MVGLDDTGTTATPGTAPVQVVEEQRADDITHGSRHARGLIVRPIGNLNVLSPALILSREEIDWIVAILRDAIEATMAELDREGFDFAA